MSSTRTDAPSKRHMDALWDLWRGMAGMYPKQFHDQHGVSPVAGSTLTTNGKVWLRVLAGLTPAQVARGADACLHRFPTWLPKPGEFRGLCLALPSLDEVMQQMGGNRDMHGFTLMIRAQMDLHAYTAADGRVQLRMLEGAYARALELVSNGAPIPAPLLALPYEAPKIPEVKDRDAARAAMEAAAAEVAELYGKTA